MKKIRFTCALVAAFGLGAAGAAVMRAQVPTAKAEKSAAGGLFIGTEGLGHVSPAAAAPFGAIQAGPDTSAFADRYVGDWPHTCGYQHPDRYLFRFSQNRFYGIGCGSMGLVGLLPSDRPFAGTNAVWCAEMDKSTERAEPGFYGVKLANGISCEVVARPHTAAYRFRFPRGRRARLLVDADWGVLAPGPTDSPNGFFNRHVTDGAVELSEPDLALVHCRQTEWNDIEAWAAIRFSRPVVAQRLLRASEHGRGETWEYDFGVPEDGSLEVRLALSSVSIRGAERNLRAEMPRFDFDGQRRAAAADWKVLLGRIRLDDDCDPTVRRNFEAAYYRTLIHPSDIGDVGKSAYSNMSLWDIFRACAPLHTIVCPDRSAAYVASMLDIFERQGYLPILHNWGRDNHCMVGHHAVPVIVDNFLKGTLGPEDGPLVRGLYGAVRDSLTRRHVKSNDGTWGLVKEDWDILDRYGYYPFDRMRGGYRGYVVKGESVSRTLECAYDDACAAKFAAALGKADDAAFFARRAAAWRNVFDATVGFMRGRDSSGRWREPFDPKSCGAGPWAENDFTEGNSWQYTWHVMHDIPGLVGAMGGAAAFGAKLEALFGESSEVYGTSFVHDVSGLIGQYAHGNEPSHHVAYLFRFSDRPWLTDVYVRRICRTMYRPEPNGLCGNDDSGQMAAWYVLSSLGFYPVDACGGDYVIGAPQVTGATIALPDGRTFRIRAKGLSESNLHVKSVRLNGRPVADWKLRHADIVCGGELEFEMGPEKHGRRWHP